MLPAIINKELPQLRKASQAQLLAQHHGKNSLVY